MTEQLAELTGPVTGESLTGDLKAMKIRGALVEGWFGSSLLGMYVPTLRSWAAGEPEAIGAAIHEIVDSDDRTLRLYSLSKEGGFTRRLETVTRLKGSVRARLADSMETSTLRDAEVTGVRDVEVPRGTLPLLRLMELGNPRADEEFVLALPDLAHRVQSGFAEITVT
jgi:hypothetical protein